MKKPKFSHFLYKIADIFCSGVSHTILKRDVTKNDLKNSSGGGVVISNHESSMDIFYFGGISKRPIHFVMSRSYFATSPFPNLFYKIGALPKSQFQTSIADIKNMKLIVDSGELLGIFPAGLMTEDGISTPIPGNIGKLVKFLDCDVYVSRIIGSYFVNPKWSKKLRPGKTKFSVTKIYSKEDLKKATIEEIDNTINQKIYFDAYEEQNELMFKYKNCKDISGIENVLFKCPKCGAVHKIVSTSKDTIECLNCGLKVTADKYGFLHSDDKEFKFTYPSNWSRWIDSEIEKDLTDNFEISVDANISKLDYEKNKYIHYSSGLLKINNNEISCILDNGEVISNGIMNYPTLPFQTDKCIDFQVDGDIFRIFPKESCRTTEIVKTVRLLYKRARKN